MWTIKQPSQIIFGKNSAKNFQYPKNCLIVTSKGAKSRGWLQHCGLDNQMIFDQVESNPSIETVEKVISQFENENFSHCIGIGGGSSMDVAKYCAFKMNKRKIMIPTTFGSGSEVTRISVLKVCGKKKSFHDDGLFADVAIVDPFFIENSDADIRKNSVIDACAQCSESYDCTISNQYTKFMCKTAFELLEEGILGRHCEKIVLGSLMSGLGFGNASTTLGHALSYVFSNEGYSHGHALAFTTTVAHKFNNSKFYQRFSRLVSILSFEPIHLIQNLDEASDTILSDRKHLDRNPIPVTKNDIELLLKKINDGKTFE